MEIASEPAPAVRPAAPSAPATDRMCWTIHPAAAQKGRAAVVAAIVLLAAVAAAQASGSTLAGLAGLALLAGSLRAYFLPRTYRLDRHAAGESGPLARSRCLRWSEVRRVTRARHGVHLSPREIDSRWLADRGLFLRTRGNRDEVAAFAEARIVR